MTAVAVADSKIVSSSADGTMQVWKLASGRELHTLEGHTVGEELVTRLGISSSGISFMAGHTAPVAVAGGRIVSGSHDGMVRVWQLTTGRELHTLEGHTTQVTAVAVADDKIVSSSADGTVRVWQLASGRELLRWDGDAGVGVCTTSVVDTDGNRLTVVAGDDGGAVHILELLA